MPENTRSNRPFPRTLVLVATLAVAGVVTWSTVRAAEEGAVRTQPGENAMATVRVMQSDGTLAPPQSLPMFKLSDAEWKKKLTPEQYRITRTSGTEPAFCGGLLKNHEAGMYVCVGCGLPLFESKTKFDSGTGWPSFYAPAVPENAINKVDRSYGMERTKVACARCDAHLGHVFDDGPKPTGLRYCMNSDAMRFVPEAELKTLANVDGNATTQPASR